MGALLQLFTTSDIKAEITDLQRPSLWLRNWAAGGARTLSGENVSAHSAMALAAYYDCIRIIAEDISKLPITVYSVDENRRNKKAVLGHAVHYFFNHAPNPYMGAMSFRETLMHHALGWGNGYAEIVMDGAGRPVQLVPIHPSRVLVRRDGQRIYYDVYENFQSDLITPITDIQTATRIATLDTSEMFHIHGLGGNGLLGYSVIDFARESIGLGLAAQKSGAALFGNGLSTTGVLEHPESLGDDAIKHLRESLANMHTGGASNANRPMILEEGMKWNPISIPPEQAQFLETREFQVTEICRWFRVPPSKLGQLNRAQGWSTLEATNTDYQIDALLPWEVRWEQETKRKLIPEENVFIEHDAKILLRGDIKARGEYQKTQFAIGALAPNEAREEDGRDPVDGGETCYVPVNMRPIDEPFQPPAAPGAAFGKKGETDENETGSKPE